MQPLLMTGQDLVHVSVRCAGHSHGTGCIKVCFELSSDSFGYDFFVDVFFVFSCSNLHSLPLEGEVKNFPAFVADKAH